MKKFFLSSIFIYSLVFSVFAISNVKAQEDAVSPESKVVNAIEVKGNKTISIATILSKIKTRVGQNYIQSVVSDDLKRLYNTGYFSDVRVDREDLEGGFKVLIYLEEKPIIEEITFSKTRHIKAKALKNKIETKAGKFLDNKILRDDIQTVKDLYTQKGLTNVEVEVETFVDEVTNKVSLHFVVREGQKIKVAAINIYGNDSFRDKKIAKVIKTRKKWLIFRKGYLKEDVLEEDVERIIAFYEQQGYIDATAKYTVDYQYKGDVAIDIEISEGRRYHVGSIVLTGNNIISEKEITRVMEEIYQDGVFSRSKLSVDIANVRTLYFDRGYIFAQVNDSVSLDPDTGNVDLKVSIEEGGLAFIEKVKIQGNTRTRDSVIRRELKLYPGDRFDGAKLRRSKERLNNLGYFEDVSFDIEDTDEYDRKDLVAQVKEAKTGTFSFGGGFSTVDKVVGFIELEQRNFDITNWPTLTGGGQRLSLRAETGSTRNNYRLSFSEPWLFDNPISFGVDLFRLEKEREEDTGFAYDEKRTGGALSFGKRFTDYVSGNVSYKNELVDIDNFADGVAQDLLDEAGENRVSQGGIGIARDTRDNVFVPTKGYTTSAGFTMAGGPFGADKDFYRLELSGSYYIPFKFDSVLEFRVRTGWVNEFDDTDKVPIFERFFAGGARSIRGYDERDVGPIDSNNENAIGGESLLVANMEYTVPIIDFVKLAAFFDTGNVWADVNDFASGGLKSGTGLGLRIKTPIGPVRLDYGIPLNDVPSEDKKSGKFYFSVSRGF